MLDYLLEEPCEKPLTYLCPKCWEPGELTKNSRVWCPDCNVTSDIELWEDYDC